MGLSSRTIVRRLRAWHLGEPVTLGTTIHTKTAEAADRLLLAFVKMGGETRPWAVMWKRGTKKPEFRFVPEPRSRLDVDAMVAELGAVVAAHLRHPTFEKREATEHEDLAPIRQIWVANGSHVDMFHHLAYAYAFRKPETDHASELRLLGRTCGFAFLEAQRPGQQLVFSASDALRSAYDFPAEDVRQAHLGFLLAWLTARGNGDHGLGAALEAERQPVATAMLPDLERKRLSPLVEAYNEAERGGNKRGMADAERDIGALLRPELERRLDLVQQAIDLIVDDPRPVNRGVEKLVEQTLSEQWWRYVRPELKAIEAGKDPFVPSAETDFQARGAAERYFRHNASADRMFAALVHDDRELEAEAIATGRAFRGTIVKVWDDGTGRKTIPMIRVEDPSPGPLSMRAADSICIVGHEKRTGRIRAIDPTKGGGFAITVEIQGRKTKAIDMDWPHSMHAADERWIGQNVTLIGTSFAEMTDKKARMVGTWDELPGDWILIRRTERDVADEVDATNDEVGVA